MNIEDLHELEQESIQRKVPIIGPEKGAFLLDFIKQHQPKTILELGTATGYSGIILGSEKAKLTTLDKSPKAIEEAKINFQKYNTNVKIIRGDIVENIKTLSQTFDLIFIDFALSQYITILDDCLRLTKPRSYIIADNINLKVKKNTGIKHCQDFKKAILNNPQLQTEIINIKDGLSVSKKLPL